MSDPTLENPTLESLAAEVRRLQERMEQMEDLMDLRAAVERNAGKAGTPWEQVKAELDSSLLAMTLTAVFTSAPEGGYTAIIEEIPGAISEGETIEEARANLADALRMVLECNREIARQQSS